MQGYPQQVLDYFVEIAIGTQYGDENAIIHKWNHDIRVQVFGMATAEDKNVLDYILDELNGLVQGIKIELVWSSPTTKLYFAPPVEFTRIEPHYVPPNTAFFWSRWSDWSIDESTILIASEGIFQQKRSHHIVAMLCKNLGLMKRSSVEPASIFFNGESESVELADVDRLLIQMLYDPAVMQGMTADEVRQALPVDPATGQGLQQAAPSNAPTFCPFCGASRVGNARYCENCGASFEAVN